MNGPEERLHYAVIWGGRQPLIRGPWSPSGTAHVLLLNHQAQAQPEPGQSLPITFQHGERSPSGADNKPFGRDLRGETDHSSEQPILQHRLACL